MKSEQTKEKTGKLYGDVKRFFGVGSAEEELEEQIAFDQNITDTYGICDVEIPLFGHICDKFDYPDEHWGWKIMGIFLLSIVIFIDIVLEGFTILSQLLGEALDGVPIIGGIWGVVEGLEIDDMLDTFSLVVVFIFCGPIAALMPAFGEFQEGVIELLPWWTISIGVWFFLVRPARARMMQLEELGVVEDDIRIGDDEFEKLSDEEMIGRAKKVYMPDD